MTTSFGGFYAVAPIGKRWAWATWPAPAPTGRPWRTPSHFGFAATELDAATAADGALRSELGRGVPTRQVDPNFARAAAREAAGKPPRFQRPRPRRPRPPKSPEERERERRIREASDELREIQALQAARRRAVPPCARVLGVSWPCTAADVRRAYRRRALEVHPDRGGSAAAFVALTRARDEALAAAEGPRT